MGSFAVTGRPIGVFWLSLLPGSYGPGGLQRSVEEAVKLKFDGIQASPVRGWRFHKDSYPFIISTQPAWNSGSLWDMALRYAGRDPNGPLLHDMVLFGRSQCPIIETALNCVPVFMDQPLIAYQKSVTEINPELSIVTANYVEYAQKGGLLCWDTYNTRRVHRGYPEDFSYGKIDWVDLINSLPGESIGLIHVQPRNPQEEADFLAGRNGVLKGMLIALKDKVSPKTPIILEIYPSLLNPRRNEYRLRSWLDRLRDLMD